MGTSARPCLLACEHCFHAGCIDTWLTGRDMCPICRVGVVSGAAAAAVAAAAVASGGRRHSQDAREAATVASAVLTEFIDDMTAASVPS